MRRLGIETVILRPAPMNRSPHGELVEPRGPRDRAASSFDRLILRQAQDEGPAMTMLVCQTDVDVRPMLVCQTMISSRVVAASSDRLVVRSVAASSPVTSIAARQSRTIRFAPVGPGGPSGATQGAGRSRPGGLRVRSRDLNPGSGGPFPTDLRTRQGLGRAAPLCGVPLPGRTTRSKPGRAEVREQGGPRDRRAVGDGAAQPCSDPGNEWRCE
jgi:hypothetical protein